jgi:chromate reductase
MKVVAVSGSIRPGSLNSALLELAVQSAPADVEVEIWRSDEHVPRVDATRGIPFPAAVEEMRRRVHHADALLIATPEFNRSIPGMLKDIVDWLSISAPPRPLVGKPVLLMSASPQRHGGISAQVELGSLLFRAGARVLTNGEVAVGAAHLRLGDDEPAEQVRSMWDLLLANVELGAAVGA